MATVDDVLKRIHALLVFGRPYYNRVEIKTSQTWTVPAGVTKIGVFLVGGGGGAGTHNKGWSAGAGGGYVYRNPSISVTPGQQIVCTIGAGGAGSTGGVAAGNKGGTTKLLTYSAEGGFPSNSRGDGGDGGSGGGNADGIGGKNGAHGAISNNENNASVSAGGGRGGGIPTVDPWDNDKLYASGGDGGFVVPHTVINGAPNTGDGGKGGYYDIAGGGTGGSGIIVIYY